MKKNKITIITSMIIFIICTLFISVIPVNASENINARLIEAIIDGNLEQVINCVENGADVNYKNKDGKIPYSSPGHENTPLNIAVYYGHIDIVKFLVENNVNVNYVDKAGDKALNMLFNAMYVGYCKHEVGLDIAVFLLNNGTKVNDLSSAKAFKQLLEIENTDNTVAKLMIEKGVDLNLKCGNDNSSPFSLFYYIDLIIQNLLILLEHGAKLDPKYKSKSGITYLMLTASLDMKICLKL